MHVKFVIIMALKCISRLLFYWVFTMTFWVDVASFLKKKFETDLEIHFFCIVSVYIFSFLFVFLFLYLIVLCI